MNDQIIPGAQPVPRTPIGLEVTAQRAAVAQRSIISAREPIVTPQQREFDISDAMVASGKWGEPREIIRYLRDVNGVPECAAVEVNEYDNFSTKGTRLVFTWWEIDALVPREGGGY